MDFDELYKSIILSEKTILEQVDEYTLYCYYTGIDPLILGKACPSPYRKDDIPSFSVFPSKSNNVEYMWKDHATGDYGNIFKLVQKIEQLDNKNQVLGRINEDFGLGYTMNDPIRKEKIIWYEKPKLNQIKIRVVNQELTQKGKAFWDQFRIDKSLLDLYQTTQILYSWSYIGQPAPITAHDPTFAYRIGDYYQLYSPYAPKEYKFRNDYPENYFFGYLQLPQKGDVLIIDKSAKDVIFCRRLGFNAVTGKSETTFIPHNKVLELKKRFGKIYLMLDNDGPGRAMTEKYIKEYPFLIPRFIPNELAKDKTDLCKKVGFEKAQEVINKLVNESSNET